VGSHAFKANFLLLASLQLPQALLIVPLPMINEQNMTPIRTISSFHPSPAEKWERKRCNGKWSG